MLNKREVLHRLENNCLKELQRSVQHTIEQYYKSKFLKVLFELHDQTEDIRRQLNNRHDNLWIGIWEELNPGKNWYCRCSTKDCGWYLSSYYGTKHYPLCWGCEKDEDARTKMYDHLSNCEWCKEYQPDGLARWYYKMNKE